MRVGVVGFGRFGRALGELVLRRGGEVVAFDTAADVPEGARAGSIEDVAARAEVIAVATPIAAMPEVFERVAHAVASRPSAPLVMDVGSVKVAPVRALARSFGADARAVGTHPLFGPTSLARGASPLTVVVCPSAREDATRDAEAFWQSLGCATVRASAEEHDRVMARTHALAFFFAKGVVDANLADPPPPFAPPSYEALARSIEAVRSDAGHLFRSIAGENPFAAAVRSELLRALVAADAELTRDSEPDLAQARDLIDEVDRDLVRLLARRAELGTRAARAKDALGVAVRDPAREAAVFASRRAWAAEAGLDPDAVADVFDAILRFSLAHQVRR